jgi:hypothetical protein
LTESLNQNGSCVQFYLKNSDTLLIWFGGAHEPFFSESYAESSRHDCIFFRDGSIDWYTNGVKDFLDTEHDLIEYLEKLRSKYKSIIFAGQSSGGQAALYYGKICNVDLCIVFAPQIKNVFDGQCRMTPTIKITNLEDLYAKGENPKVILNVSRSESDHLDVFQWNDIDRIEKFKSLDCVTLITHPYDNHAVAVKLREHGILYSFVDNLIAVYSNI